MTLREIQLTNFKNIAGASLTLSPKLNCFLGDNGQGKSNMVDAIHYLSFCKSFTGAPDALLIRRGEDFALLKGRYRRREADEEVSIGLSLNRRKAVKRGGKEYQKITEHIGNFPSVLISPADMDLVYGTGEDRRRFMDMAISQSDARYLTALVNYNRALAQRNRLLRDGFTTDAGLYAAIETAMDAAAAYIVSVRADFVTRLSEIHRKYYAAIAGGDAAEETGLTYRSQLEGGITLTALLDANRTRDIVVRHTTAGPHRDDLEFTVNDLPLRRTASQGQQKTFTIALRLAQYEFLSRLAGLRPLLLLDDIFDKLDARRVEAIIEVVAGPAFGQIFITDTNRRHLDDIVGHIPSEHALWHVSDGCFSEI